MEIIHAFISVGLQQIRKVHKQDFGCPMPYLLSILEDYLAPNRILWSVYLIETVRTVAV